jgi:hypothetical protein
MTRAFLAKWLLPAAAALALGYLVLMVVAGVQPVQRQLVRFEAQGVLRQAPEAVRRVMLGRGDRSLTLVRTGENAWTTEAGADVGSAAGTHLDTAVKMMHRSGPVREIGPEELTGVDSAPFGLQPPVLTVSLFGEAGGPLLAVGFGALNPEGFLQYMRIDGEDRLLLMSRFVGAEWVAALESAAAP